MRNGTRYIRTYQEHTHWQAGGSCGGNNWCAYKYHGCSVTVRKELATAAVFCSGRLRTAPTLLCANCLKFYKEWNISLLVPCIRPAKHLVSNSLPTHLYMKNHTSPLSPVFHDNLFRLSYTCALLAFARWRLAAMMASRSPPCPPTPSRSSSNSNALPAVDMADVGDDIPSALHHGQGTVVAATTRRVGAVRCSTRL